MQTTSPRRFGITGTAGQSIVSALAILGLWAGVAVAAATPLWPHTGSDLQPDPALVFGHLDNGLRYVLRVNRTPRDRVSMHLNVQVGSLHENDDQRGLAHFLEHMLFNGSTHFAPGELVKYFQRIGMAFGDDANAHTGFNQTAYDVLLPDNRAESIAEGLLVLFDYARGALLLPEEVAAEREVVLAEMRTRDTPAYRTFEATLGFEFGGLRIAERLPIGLRAVIEQADRQALKTFYDDWYRPERMVLVIVGDFDPASARTMIRERFGGLENRGRTPDDPSPGRLEHHGIKPFYHYEPELGHSKVSVGQVHTVAFEADTVAFQQRRLAEEIATRALDNRLQTLLSHPDAPFTRVSASAGIFLKTLRYAELEARPRDGLWEQALSLLEQTLRQALTHGFAAAEIDRVSREMKAELEKAVGQAATRQSPALAREIIGHLNAERVMLAPDQELALLAPMIQDFSPAQIHEAFRRTWNADHRLVEVTGKVDLSGAASDPQTRIRQAYQHSLTRPVGPWQADRTPAFPYLASADQAAAILERIDHKDPGIVQIQFANGTGLSLKQTDFKDDEVRLSLDLEFGRNGEPADRPGLAQLTEAFLNESGLGALTRDDLERALAGRNLSMRIEIGEDRLRLIGETVPGELPLLFELLRHRLLDPGWRQSAFDLVQSRFEEQYADLKRSIEGQMMLHGRRFLAGGDSRFGLPPPETFRKLTIEDVRRWVVPILQTAPLSLSVVGDFEPDQVIALAGRYLGTLPARAPIRVTPRPGPVFPAGQRIELDVDTRLDKGMVVVAFATEDLWDIGRTRRLNQLAEVFSDRLRERIREKLGASYSPFAHHWPSRAYDGYGMMAAMVQLDPDRAEAVIAEIEGIVADLAANGVGPDEFLRSREPTLTGIKDMRRQNGYWLDTVLSGAWKHPQQIEWSRTIMDDYAGMQSEEISALAARYLKADKQAIIVIKPQTKSDR